MSKIIDVSKWNYPVDWDAVVKSGITGVIVRAGSGVTEDERMKYFTNEVIKRGLTGLCIFILVERLLQIVSSLNRQSDRTKIKSIWGFGVTSNMIQKKSCLDMTRTH